MYRQLFLLGCLVIASTKGVDAQSAPPPPGPIPSLTGESSDWWLAAAQAQMVQIADWSQGNPERLRELGALWLAEGYDHLAPYLPHLWAQEVSGPSMTEGASGIILSVPAPRLSCTDEGCRYWGCLRCKGIVAYLPHSTPDEDSAGRFFQNPQVITPWSSNPTFDAPRPYILDDLTGDGRLELVVESEHVMAMGLSRNWSVFRQIGEGFHRLGTVRAAYPEPEAGVPDLEIIDSGSSNVRLRVPVDLIASVGAGLQRGGYRYFRLTDDAVEQDGFVPKPSSHPYYLALDARTALGRGDLDGARDLSERGRAALLEDHWVPDGDLRHQWYLDDESGHQLRAYFALLEMMVAAVVVDAFGLQRRFNEVSQVPANPMRDLALLFFRELQEHGDVERACHRLEEESARRASEIRPLTFVGYATEELKVSCPTP